MELELDGRHITVERSTKGRVPMGEFRAYETHSGQEIPELTADNCGQRLLGVSRSVFARSAFLGQNELAVTSDAELEKKLSSLVTTGDETVAFSDTEKRLRDWKNHCRHNRTGLLPQAQQELEQVQSTLEQIHRLHRNDLELSEKREQLLQEQARLNALTAALEAQETNRRFAQKQQAQAELEAAAQTLHQLRQAAQHLPPQQTLQQMQRELELFQLQMQDLPETPTAPTAPECPAVFAGLRETELMEKARQDAAEFERLTAGKRSHPTAFFLGAAGLAALGAVLLVLRQQLFALPALAAAAIMTVLGICAAGYHNKRKIRLAKAQALQDAYGALAHDAWVAYAAEYQANVQLHAQLTEQYERRLAEHAQKQQTLNEQRARLMGQISMFAPQSVTEQQAEQALTDALALLEQVQQAEQEEKNAKVRHDSICAALGDLQPAASPQMDLQGLDLRQVSAQLLQTDSRLNEVRSQLDLSRGRVEALGDPATLQARCGELTERIERLSRRYEALELAAKTLERVHGELQTRFSPAIGALAGELLGKMTGQRYDTVLLGADLRAEARETGELVTRQLLSLSGGTADQVYLAVRLAICRLALEPHTPLVLDDALVRFDDMRMQAALKLLREEAKTRQVLLFTCQNREQQALEQNL